MPRESLKARRARAEELLSRLQSLYPNTHCALVHRNAFELLVATILSAQCTDDRVNRVTPALFAAYPDAHAMAAASIDDLVPLISSTGFFNNKARNLKGMATMLVNKHGGQVPADMALLTELPGVARKTANVVLGTWFGINAGVVVDTHVGRLATRLRLAPNARDDKDAVTIESDLQAVIPQTHWTFVSHALIDHGRQVCPARKPKCSQCTLRDLCPTGQAEAQTPTD